MNKPVERPHTSFEDDGHAIGGGPDNKLDIFDRSELRRRYEERKREEALTEEDWFDQIQPVDEDVDGELDELEDLLAGDRAMRPIEALMRLIDMCRHGATAMNDDDASIDRIRGWVDVALSEIGRQEAMKIAKKIAKDPPQWIVSSDLARAYDTAKIISEACGEDANGNRIAPIVEVSRGFRPWNVGHFTGELSDVAVPILREYLERDPSDIIPGGESFCDFRDRFFSTLRDTCRRYPSGRILVVAHHRNERLMFGAQAAGWPDDWNVNPDVFSEKGERTGTCQTLEVPVAFLEAR